MPATRKFILIAGLVIFVLGVIIAWRAMHPPLSPTEQIKANLEAMKSGIEQRNVRAASRYLSKDFHWRDVPRAEITKQHMPAAFFMWRDVHLQISNLQTEVHGETATSTGRFTLNYRPQADMAPEVRTGKFKIEWQLEDGEWKAIKGEGGESIGP